MAEKLLVCLPFAGAGASFFRAWLPLVPGGVRLLPVQLPGREARFPEPPLAEVAAAVHDAHAQLTPHLRSGAQVALFGHSLGAVLAYELALRLSGTPGPELVALFVSGSPDPWNSRSDTIAHLPDDEFAAGVERLAGYVHPAMSYPEARELLLPALRADFAMHESYQPASAGPLTVPVTALRGTGDDLVSRAAIEGWSKTTTGQFFTAEVEGGHMYLVDNVSALLALIGAHLSGEPA